MKRIISYLLTLALLLGLMVVPAYASNDESNSKNVKVTEQVIEEIALNWADFISPTVKLSAKDIVPVFDTDDQLSGCSVSYFYGDTPYGYAILDFFSENIISEFVIKENAISIFDSILRRSKAQKSTNKNMNKMYKMLPFEYLASVETGSEQFVYDAMMGKISKENFHARKNELNNTKKDKQKEKDYSSEKKYTDFGDVFIDSIPEDYSTVDPLKSLSSTASISEAEIEDATGKYACAVTAMTNVMKQNSLLKNDSIADTFNALWTKSETTETSDSKKNTDPNKIIYGSTYDSKIGPAVVSLAKELGKKSSSYTSSSSPTYSTYKTAVTNGKSSNISFRITVNDEEVGHTVSVVGYCSAKDSSKKVYQYLYIADGWYNTLRYICPTTAGFVSSYGVVYTFK